MDITQLLAFSVKNKASDLHLSAGLPPMIRVHGDVRRINVEACLLYTSDAADERSSVDLGGRRIIKKKK